MHRLRSIWLLNVTYPVFELLQKEIERERRSGKGDSIEHSYALGDTIYQRREILQK